MTASSPVTGTLALTPSADAGVSKPLYLAATSAGRVIPMRSSRRSGRRPMLGVVHCGAVCVSRTIALFFGRGYGVCGSAESLARRAIAKGCLRPGSGLRRLSPPTQVGPGLGRVGRAVGDPLTHGREGADRRGPAA
jgi:hypothetical protein